MARSGRGATDPDSAKARATTKPTDDDRIGPVPEDNQPGHRPKVEQDKPDPRAFAAKAANPGADDGTGDGASADDEGDEGGPNDALEMLIADHRTVDALFDEYEALGRDGDPAEKRRVVKEFTRELSVHAAIEEQYLYPLMAMVLENGREVVKETLAEHQQVKERLAALERARDDAMDAQVKALVGDIRHHVQEEENDLFPRLRERAGDAQMRAVGLMMRGTKLIAPTRPHPKAPNTPPGNFLVAPIAGMVDRARDLIESIRR